MEFLHWGLIFWFFLFLFFFAHWSDARTHRSITDTSLVGGEANEFGLQCFWLGSYDHAAVMSWFFFFFLKSRFLVDNECHRLRENVRVLCSIFGVKRWKFTDATFCSVAKPLGATQRGRFYDRLGSMKRRCRCQWRGIDPQTLLVPNNLPLTVKTNSICVHGPFTVKWVQLSGFLEIWMCDI